MNAVGRPWGDQLVGVVPAAGRATRSAPLPCSKEIFPVGFWEGTGESRSPAPKPACAYLLEAMRVAGARRVMVGLGPEKWDIPACLGDGALYDLALAYTVVADSPGVPWTVSAALHFVSGARVVFGFPDIVFAPVDALARVEQRQRESGADVALGLFPAQGPEKMDMVAVDGKGSVHEIVIKPKATDLKYAWILAVWTPAFSVFLDTCLRRGDMLSDSASEVHVGAVLQAALTQGWSIEGVVVPDGQYYDIGTPAELAEAVHAPPPT